MPVSPSEALCTHPFSGGQQVAQPTPILYITTPTLDWLKGKAVCWKVTRWAQKLQDDSMTRLEYEQKPGHLQRAESRNNLVRVTMIKWIKLSHFSLLSALLGIQIQGRSIRLGLHSCPRTRDSRELDSESLQIISKVEINKLEIKRHGHEATKHQQMFIPV